MVYPNFLQEYGQSCREQGIDSEGGWQGAALWAFHAQRFRQSDQNQGNAKGMNSLHLISLELSVKKKRKITS